MNPVIATIDHVSMTTDWPFHRFDPSLTDLLYPMDNEYPQNA